MTEDEKIAAIKEWYQEHLWDSWVDWDAFAELGAILKQETVEAEPEEDYPMSEHVRKSPFEWSEPVRSPNVDPDLKFMLVKKLDPLPYAQYVGTAIEQRYSINDPARVHGMFLPRPMYEQEYDRYYRTSFGYRNRRE